jgi:hypothetical protein
MATRAELVEELLKFPAPERAEAARSLLESLDGSDDPAEVGAAWQTEIARRVGEIEDGSVELEDGPSVLRELRQRARNRLDSSES